MWIVKPGECVELQDGNGLSGPAKWNAGHPGAWCGALQRGMEWLAGASDGLRIADTLALQRLPQRGWTLRPLIVAADHVDETAAGDGWLHWLATPVEWEPPRRVRAIVSSRIGRGVLKPPAWIRELRKSVAGTRDGTSVLAVTGTTTAAWVACCAAGLQVSCVELTTSDKLRNSSHEHWLRHVIKRIDRSDQNGKQLWLSPATRISTLPIQWPADECGVRTSQARGDANPAETDSVPPPIAERDRVQCCLADEFVLLHCRAGGAIDWLWNRQASRAAKIPLSMHGWPELSGEPAFGKCGSVCHPLLPISTPLAEHAEFGQDDWGDVRTTSEHDEWFDEPYLVHWTRSADRPFGDYSDDEWLRAQLFGPAECDWSELGGLRRILRQQRLIGSRRGIPGGQRVVCFADWSLSVWRRARKFQTHRGRWDAEPYGLCFRLEFLVGLGACRVEYASAAMVAGRPADQRWTYQPERTGRRQQLDWRREREWRVAGDVDLSRAGDDDVRVVVASPEDIPGVRPVSRWPLVILNGRSS